MYFNIKLYIDHLSINFNMFVGSLMKHHQSFSEFINLQLIE